MMMMMMLMMMMMMMMIMMMVMMMMMMKFTMKCYYQTKTTTKGLTPLNISPKVVYQPELIYIFF